MDFPFSDINQMKIKLLTDICRVSVVARQYVESGRYVDDAQDPDEENITVDDVFKNVVDILLAELEQLGILYNEPIEQMTGDLYRVGVLVALRTQFDKDIFAYTLAQLPVNKARLILAIIHTASDGTSDPGEIVQLVIHEISGAITLSTSWELLNTNLRLFASTDKFVAHLVAIANSYIEPVQVTADNPEALAKFLSNVEDKRQGFKTALLRMNKRYQLLTDSEIQILVRDYARGIEATLGPNGVIPAAHDRYLCTLPYHFRYYQSRNLPLNTKALVMIAAAMSTEIGRSITRVEIARAGSLYELTFETQAKLTEMLTGETSG